MSSATFGSASAAKGVAIVTGCARGIGRAIALRLATDGYDVGINDVAASLAGLQSLEVEIKALGRKTSVCPADVSVESEVEGMVKRTVQELGGLDIMVANAGILNLTPFLELTAQEWTHLFAVNVTGVMLCFKYAGEVMVKQGRGGRLLAACSIAGKKGFAAWSAYSSSKFAVRGLVQSVALALGPHGITVNAYAPGAIDTDMMKIVDENALQVLKGMAALGRTGQTQDIAAIVSFLSSKEASFITGQSVSVDGGWHFD